MSYADTGGSRTKRGAVLLETLIVIPLFLLLVGGTMWIGDLILAKQQGVIADRYGAWNLGNMYRGDETGMKDEVQDLFFPPSAHPHQKSILRPSKPIKYIRWWNSAYSTVSLFITMPEWTKGWYASTAQVHLHEPVPELASVKGRDVPGMKHHMVVMRTWRSKESNYPRNWSGKDLAGLLSPWSWLVYKEPWPPDLKMMLPITSMPGQEYTRYGPYVAISL